MAGLLAALLCTPATVQAEPVIEGTWVIDEKLSDDVEDAFDGKLRKRGYPVPKAPSRSGQPEGPYDKTQADYWETVRAGKERHSVKNLRRLGAVYPLVIASRVDVSRGEEGYDFLYDGELPRAVKPNAEGRVFSASGEELVTDTLGFTLAYWDRDALMLEIDPPDGGKVVEKITVNDNPPQLHYAIKLIMRILKEPVEIKRVFVPAS